MFVFLIIFFSEYRIGEQQDIFFIRENFLEEHLFEERSCLLDSVPDSGFKSPDPSVNNIMRFK